MAKIDKNLSRGQTRSSRTCTSSMPVRWVASRRTRRRLCLQLCGRSATSSGSRQRSLRRRASLQSSWPTSARCGQAAAELPPDTLAAETLVALDYDNAFPTLIRELLPMGNGIKGFVLAAIFGAVVSSLASMLNSASTIFTMDIYHKLRQPREPVRVGDGRPRRVSSCSW